MDHIEELEERIRKNCLTRWEGNLDFHDEAAVDQAYCQMVLVLMALEEQDAGD